MAERKVGLATCQGPQAPCVLLPRSSGKARSLLAAAGMNPNFRSILSLSCVFAIGAAGCATTQPAANRPPAEAPATPPAPVVRNEPPTPKAPEQAAPEPLDFGPIFYALDSAQLTPESQQLLDRVAEALRKQPQAQVTVAGHTCELGTVEYNLALGQRRAVVVRDYLRRMGVEPSRVKVVSFGEESPRAAGSSEDAYQQNRRSEFNIAGTQSR